MLTKNMGGLDRTVRFIVGVVLVVMAVMFLGSPWNWVAGIAGLVLGLTASFGFCPPYALLGIKTCKMKD